MPMVLGVRDGATSTQYSVIKRNGINVTRKEFTKIYEIIGDHLSHTEEDILSTSGIPPFYSTVNGAIAKEFDLEERATVTHPTTGERTILYACTVDFDSATEIPDQETENPLNVRPEIDWSSQTVEETIDEDLDENPIVTSADEPIVLTAPFSDPVLTVRRYEAFPFDPDIILKFVNHLNFFPFYGAPQGTVLMESIRAREPVSVASAPGVQFSQVTYQMRFKLRKRKVDGEEKGFKENTWIREVLNTGNKYRPQDGDDPVVHPDAPILLADNGTIVDSANKTYKKFRVNGYANFATRNLGPF